MFDHLIMPPRAGYAVITTNDFMVIVRDTGDIVSVLEDADAVLEHLSLTIPGGLRRKRVYVESAPSASDFYEVMHESGDLLDIVMCSADQADYLQQHIASLEGAPEMADSLAMIPYNVTGGLAEASNSLTEAKGNPALSYLMGLGSRRSRVTMRSHLQQVAYLSGGHDIKSCPWHMIRREHVRSIIEMMSELGKAPSTINTALSAMKGVAREAWVAGRMDSESHHQISDLKSVRGSRLPKGVHLDDVAIQALCSACETDETPKGERDAVLLHLLVNTGLRRSESVSIDIEMIDRGRQSIRILGKGNKERLVFLPNETFLKVMAWQSRLGRDVGPLFPRVRRHGVITDLRITDQAVYFIIKERAVQAGIKECAPHDFRRTFATNMLDRGVDVLTVQYALGHTNLVTTQRYDRSAERRLEEAMKRI